MRCTSRIIVALTLIFSESLVASVYANASLIQGGRVSSTPNQARLVLDIDGPIKYSMFTLANPDRVVVDLKDSKLNGKLFNQSAENHFISNFRISRLNQTDLRVVIDLKKMATPNSFLLKPNAQYGYRLVIDLEEKKRMAGSLIKTTKNNNDNEFNLKNNKTNIEKESPWYIYGNASARVEYYDNRGDPNQALYFSEGGQPYGEFEIHADKRVSPDEQIKSQAFFLANDSDYRSETQNLQAEQLNLMWEKGDAQIPFRLEAGNYYSYLSYRTIQRSLKGLQFELQPETNSATKRQSLLFFTGTPGSNYQSLDPEDNLYAGASWLVSYEGQSFLGINFVNHRVDNEYSTDNISRHQQVVSLVGYTEAEIYGQRLGFETEIGYMTGDDTSGDTTFLDEQDFGILFELTGRSNHLPLSYSARYEKYGEFFNPAAAVNQSNWKNLEFRVNWQFESGPQLTGRIQSFSEDMDSANPKDTDTVGVSLTGPVLAGNKTIFNLDADAFVQTIKDDSYTVDSRTETITLDFSRPFGEGWTVRTGLYAQNEVDDAGAGSKSQTRQVELAFQRDFKFLGDWAYVSPSIVARRMDDKSKSEELEGALTVGVSGTGYSLDAWYSHLDKDQSLSSDSDYFSHTFGLYFSRYEGAHYLEFEADYGDFGLDPGDDATSWRVALEYTYYFDKKPKTKAFKVGIPVGQIKSDKSVFSGLWPGIKLNDALAQLGEQGITNGIPTGNKLIFNTRRLLPNIFRSQKLVLIHDNVDINSSAIIIDFNRTGDGRIQQQIYEDVRQSLLKQFGNPSLNLERGEFDNEIVRNLNSRKFIRVTEWETGKGKVRFGIPRRLDNRLRMEIHFALSFPSQSNPNWGIESVN